VLNVAVDLAVTAFGRSTVHGARSVSRRMGHRPLSSGELPLPAGNAQFATSVERFLGLEHVGRHCLTAPVLGL
jgi:hypothetical protein